MCETPLPVPWILHRVPSGARVNAGRGSDSPLHAAVRQDCAEQVALLLEFGADVNLRDDNNRKASELAPPGGHVQQLLKTVQGKAVFCRTGATGVMAKKKKRSKRKLFSILDSPRSLCQLCRITIRDVIGPLRLKLLPTLPLPPLLTGYLNHS